MFYCSESVRLAITRFMQVSAERSLYVLSFINLTGESFLKMSSHSVFDLLSKFSIPQFTSKEISNPQTHHQRNPAVDHIASLAHL